MAFLKFCAIAVLLANVCSCWASPNPERRYWNISKSLVLNKEDRTVTWCSFHRGPQITKKHHVIGYDHYKLEAQVTKHTHHIDLYKCTAPPGVDATEFFEPFVQSNGFNCFDTETFFPKQYCRAYLEWSFYYFAKYNLTMYPDLVGIPLAPNEYLMLNSHFENPEGIDNLEVEAGMKFLITDELRAHESGHFLIGNDMKYTHMIPPNSPAFTLPRRCSTDCTSKLPNPIYISSFTYHAHSSAKRIKIRHFRQGQELPIITDDRHYNHKEAQKYRQLPLSKEIQVLPGDELFIECTYDTRAKNGSLVFGGRTASNEMCTAFVTYHPFVEEFTQCGSSLEEETLLHFLGIQQVQKQGKTNSGSDSNESPIVENPEHLKGRRVIEIAQNFDWTDENRLAFQNLINQGRHSDYCFGSHGQEYFYSKPILPL